MRTPAGKECQFFYGDYYRGKNHEECRLLDQGNTTTKWTNELCNTCPVPDIQAANSCPHMVLSGDVVRQFIVFGRKVQVTAYCTKSEGEVSEPKVGCGQCHPLPSIFTLQDTEE